ncbi:MAG: mycothiol conjugate amidase Mca [Mycobacteriales bacterium]
MAVHAHPDDESSKGAATMARYVREDVDVMVVTCTGGERGSILNPAMDRPDVAENISAVRAEEMRHARKILGVKQEWLGFVDSGLPEGDPRPPLPEGCFGLMDPEVAAESLVALMRSFRPHVVLTYDESGGYPHPDHIMCHTVSVQAFNSAGDAAAYPGTGDPWQPQKLYYHMGMSLARSKALHEAMLDKGLESPLAEMMKWGESEAERARAERRRAASDRITTRVPCGNYFEIRDQALIAHATQVDPTGGWFRIPLAIQREVWPTEDYELVRSMVETALPEDDLFAGVQHQPVA